MTEAALSASAGTHTKKKVFRFVVAVCGLQTMKKNMTNCNFWAPSEYDLFFSSFAAPNRKFHTVGSRQHWHFHVHTLPAKRALPYIAIATYTIYILVLCMHMQCINCAQHTVHRTLYKLHIAHQWHITAQF